MKAILISALGVLLLASPVMATAEIEGEHPLPPPSMLMTVHPAIPVPKEPGHPKLKKFGQVAGIALGLTASLVVLIMPAFMTRRS